MPFSEKRGASARLPAKTREPSESLQKLRHGEMSLDEYLDEAAEQAISVYQGKLASSDFETLRITMREHLRTDPVTLEFIRQLTGQAPSADSLGAEN